VVDHSLPEGAPLFKNGKLAGLVLLGTRFLDETNNKSYVVPVDRIASLCSRLEAGNESAAENTQATVERTAPAPWQHVRAASRSAGSERLSGKLPSIYTGWHGRFSWSQN
jgi:hypothetical protein